MIDLKKLWWKHGRWQVVPIIQDRIVSPRMQSKERSTAQFSLW
jgi:hypothetical protein